jgi:hypothetical protein
VQPCAADGVRQSPVSRVLSGTAPPASSLSARDHSRQFASIQNPLRLVRQRGFTSAVICGRQQPDHGATSVARRLAGKQRLPGAVERVAQELGGDRSDRVAEPGNGAPSVRIRGPLCWLRLTQLADTPGEARLSLPCSRCRQMARSAVRGFDTLNRCVKAGSATRPIRRAAFQFVTLSQNGRNPRASKVAEWDTWWIDGASGAV